VARSVCMCMDMYATRNKPRVLCNSPTDLKHTMRRQRRCSRDTSTHLYVLTLRLLAQVEGKAVPLTEVLWHHVLHDKEMFNVQRDCYGT